MRKGSTLPRRTPLKPKARKVARKPFGEAPSASKTKSERTTSMQYADKMFSHWVRMRAADSLGYIHCFICGLRLHWMDAVAMHCEPRICMSTRYSEINVQAGCAGCNGKPLGDRERFRDAIDARYGPCAAERNNMKSKLIEKMGSKYLQFIGDTYAQRIEWIEKHQQP